MPNQTEMPSLTEMPTLTETPSPPSDRVEPEPDDLPPAIPSAPEPAHGSRRARAGGALAAALIVAAVAAAARVSGTLGDSEATLQVMGFDPERAKLIADLVLMAVAVAMATIVTGRFLAVSVAGVATGAVMFGRTFLRETGAALHGAAAGGAFSPSGWVLTILTLACVFVVASWASASLALIVRRGMAAAGHDIATLVRGHRSIRATARPIAGIAAIALVLVTVPVFADMVNYSPDVWMRSTHTGTVGLTATGPAGAAVTSAAGPAVQPTILAPATGSSGGGTDGLRPVVRSGAPWDAWIPTGTGSVASVTWPAPWVGGNTPSATVSVYLPPGYQQSNRRYPTLYVLPWLIPVWEHGIGITGMLDSLITAGTIPATIVVFASDAGAPFAESQCVNSADGRERFDTYITGTVIPWVDAHFRTIDRAAARSTLGFSDGGFCSSMMAMRHPDLFSTGIAFSGYYQAGIITSQTPNAWRQYGGSAAAEAPYSPLTLVGQLTPAQRAASLLILEANPAEPFYGPQYASMAGAARAAGVPVALYPSAIGHSWRALRYLLPDALLTLAQHQDALGVFA